MTAKGSRTPRKSRAKGQVAGEIKPSEQVEADDLRPMLVGSRVVLTGTLRDGPEGEVVAIGADLGADGTRMVHFDGEQKAIEVPLTMLRRLP